MTPEAAVGGVIGLIEDGDRIRIDAEGRTLDLLVDDATLAGRRASWQPPDIERRGTLGKYARLVTSASRGAVTDALDD